MFAKSSMAVLMGSAMLAFSPLALSQTSADKLIQTYAEFAGSEDNARALVSGLRRGGDITLSSVSAPGATFTAPTRPMGYGNANIALALSQARLSQLGITNPAPRDLEAMLIGGSVNNASGDSAQLSGILTLRAQGLGWGQIAQSMDLKLGEVMRSERARGATPEGKPHRVAGVAKPERPEKPTRPERREGPERPVRAGR